MDWNLIRLYSVGNNLECSIGELEQNLLRYGFLIKSCLPVEYRKSLISVDYSFRKMVRPCVILQFDKTSHTYPLEYLKILLELTHLLGENKVSVYENTGTDLIVDILV